MSTYSDFEVVRVGQQVVLQCFLNATKAGGRKLSITLELGTREEAEEFEGLFKRLTACASMYEEMEDDVLQATLILTKGTQHDRKHD